MHVELLHYLEMDLNTKQTGKRLIFKIGEKLFWELETVRSHLILNL
jgi:hypothetical protein